MDLTTLAKKLKKESSIALLCHVRPDGDCLGSACSLKLAFEKLGIKAKVVSVDPVPERFTFLKEMKNVVQEIDCEYSALVAIDCADLTRASEQDKFLKHKNTYNIDHHVSNNDYAVNNYVIEESANCENAYAIIKEMGVEIDEEMANLLALGIITDTGNFKHKNVTDKCIKTVSELVSLGADLNKINYYMFTMQSKQRAKLFGLVMSKIRYFLDDRFAVATVSKSDLEKTGAKPDETEGFVDFIMGVNTVEVGACLMESDNNKYKISFRSKGADVNAVASTFGGGGHTLASGCQILGDYEDIVDRITFAVSRELKD